MAGKWKIRRPILNDWLYAQQVFILANHLRTLRAIAAFEAMIDKPYPELSFGDPFKDDTGIMNTNENRLDVYFHLRNGSREDDWLRLNAYHKTGVFRFATSLGAIVSSDTDKSQGVLLLTKDGIFDNRDYFINPNRSPNRCFKDFMTDTIDQEIPQ